MPGYFCVLKIDYPMTQPSKPLHFISTITLLAFALSSCQNHEQEFAGKQEPIPAEVPRDTVDSTVFASADTLGSPTESVKEEFISAGSFGYYRAYTPPSILLDEKGKKTVVNGNPVQVPASVSYIQLKSGRVYGVQLAQGQQYLFTGLYVYAKGSTAEKGMLNLALDGRYLKTGKPVGPWSPQIRYVRSGKVLNFTLTGVSGAPDSRMTFVAPEISTARMQQLMEEEESKL